MLLEIKNLISSYAQTGIVLNNINININKGEFIGIVGKSGSGKTTLLETIGGLHKPRSGSVIFNTKNIYEDDFDQINFRRNLQIVFQFPENQFFENNVHDEIAFGLKMLKLHDEEIERRINDISKRIFIDNSILNQSPFTLSGGQKRRLALGCALSIKPQVLLLDEPFAGLDAEGKDGMIRILKEEKKSGMTILMVSHDPDIVCELSDKVIAMSNGNITGFDTPAEVYGNLYGREALGFGIPNTKIISDMIGMDLSVDLTYNTFIKRLTSYLS